MSGHAICGCGDEILPTGLTGDGARCGICAGVDDDDSKRLQTEFNEMSARLAAAERERDEARAKAASEHAARAAVERAANEEAWRLEAALVEKREEADRCRLDASRNGERALAAERRAEEAERDLKAADDALVVAAKFIENLTARAEAAEARLRDLALKVQEAFGTAITSDATPPGWYLINGDPMSDAMVTAERALRSPGDPE